MAEIQRTVNEAELSLMGSLSMPEPTRIWRVIVSVLLIVLVVTTTMGMVWHHHDQCAGNCTLCHMVIAPPAAEAGAIGLVSVTAEYAVRENGFVSRCTANERPSRAPPA